MDRRSFLKSIGVGVAAAVIVPKVLLEPLEKKAIEHKHKSLFGKYEDEVKALHYAHYEEDLPKYTVEDLRIGDFCVDKDARAWLCTAMFFDKIEMTALEPYPEPSFIDVNRNNFDEYFIIFGSAWGLPGNGQPS